MTAPDVSESRVTLTSSANTKERGYLPADFVFAHEYCVFLYDTLVDALRDAEAAGVFAVAYAPKSAEEFRKIVSLESEAVWDWFESAGHDEVVDEMVQKRVVPAIIADLCLFIHEALSCSRRCKLTVAYALLRKPLRENLLYLEWILVDSGRFVREFRAGVPERIAMGALSWEEKRDVVMRAARLAKAASAYPENFIYDLRYAKDKDYGFEVLWNQAVHLVTTRGSIASSPQNINFVFSDESSFRSQWAHLYRTLPVLLYYTTEIVDLVIRKLAGVPSGSWLSATEFRKIVGLRMLASDDALLVPQMTPDEEAEEAGEPLLLPCPECETSFVFERSMWRHVVQCGAVVCPSCKRSCGLEEIFDSSEAGEVPGREGSLDAGERR